MLEKCCILFDKIFCMCTREAIAVPWNSIILSNKKERKACRCKIEYHYCQILKHYIITTLAVQEGVGGMNKKKVDGRRGRSFSFPFWISITLKIGNHQYAIQINLHNLWPTSTIAGGESPYINYRTYSLFVRVI